MPFWKISYGAGMFSDAEKIAIAKGATDFYVSSGLPAWYVSVVFQEFDAKNHFNGGASTSNHVVIEIVHIARRLDPNNKKLVRHVKDSFDKILAPYITGRGFHVEYAVLEGPAALWRINGIDPPEALGPDEAEQGERNRKLLQELHDSNYQSNEAHRL